MPLLPQHIAVIMDGNGRWAAQRGSVRSIGHRAGAKAVQVAIEFCLEQHIGSLTLFAFSSENWNRPPEEVSTLMKLFLRMLDTEIEELHRRGVRIRFIGQRSDFAPEIREKMAWAEALSAGNSTLNLNIAGSYGGRWDIVNACRALLATAPAAEDITEAALGRFMALADQPEPDLLIRTGGDCRISNFLLWQMAYTEFWFTPTLWPDITREVLLQAVSDFAGRERRFGLTSAQVHGEQA
ncbi:polyprenyl diphosphate synthase [Arenimonas sp. GDDSR-1]|uniref:polyprenyl diphosphate synthase n=1 Tax=Arenimonas sp. GDDSR-1 TaxID=2950125 RepID=UPI0026387634|nr:polyprenyl diphosphate synthase [Arenimonas sp. GDDSR-1]